MSWSNSKHSFYFATVLHIVSIRGFTRRADVLKIQNPSTLHFNRMDFACNNTHCILKAASGKISIKVSTKFVDRNGRNAINRSVFIFTERTQTKKKVKVRCGLQTMKMHAEFGIWNGFHNIGTLLGLNSLLNETIIFYIGTYIGCGKFNTVGGFGKH